MLPAEYRMRRAQDFQRTVRHGYRGAGPLMVVHVAREAGAGSTVKVGFVVSKAVGGAVARNRVRRRLRHLMRERLARLPGGIEVVIRARPDAAGARYETLATELDDALDRALDRTLARVPDGSVPAAGSSQ
ncbi:MAG: ribonuclease P protein component [Actinomycetota bacterium]